MGFLKKFFYSQPGLGGASQNPIIQPINYVLQEKTAFEI